MIEGPPRWRPATQEQVAMTLPNPAQVPDPTPAPADPATGSPPGQQPAAPQPPAPPTPPTAPQPPAAPADQGDPGQLGDAGQRALQAERQARRDAEALVKQLQPLADKAKELEDAEKTETQRLAEQVQAVTAERDTSAQELLQLRAALAAAPAGMDAATVASLAVRVRGSTVEEMQADAAALFQQFGGPQPPAPATPPAVPGQQTPVEHLRPGALPTPTAPSLDEQIAAATAAGDMATAMALKSQKLADVRKKQPTT